MGGREGEGLGNGERGAGTGELVVWWNKWHESDLTLRQLGRLPPRH